MSSYEMLTHAFGFESGAAKKITWDNMLIPFFIGGTSRSLASCILMPVNVVRMRLQMKSYTTEEIKMKHLQQEGNVKKEVKYDGMIDVIRKIYANEGVTAFYKGLTPSILKIFPTSGLFFIGYEMTLGILRPL